MASEEAPVGRKEFDKYFEDSEDELDREEDRVKRRKIDTVSANKAQDGEEDLADDTERDLGFKVEAFNQKDDREDGYFDEDGAYRARKDDEDPWLDEVDEGAQPAMRINPKHKADHIDHILQSGSKLPPGANASASSSSSSAKANSSASGELTDEQKRSTDQDELTLELALRLRERVRSLLVEPNVSVSKVLSQYGGSKKKKSKKRGRSRKKRSWETSDSDDEDNDESMSGKLSAEQFSQLTDSVNTLVSRASDYGVYEDTQASLDAKIRRARAELAAWRKDDKVWFYKWKADDAKIEGPCAPGDMKAWHEKEYFKDKDIVLRKVGDESWILSKDFDFTTL